MNYKYKISSSEMNNETGGIIPLETEEYDLFLKQKFWEVKDDYLEPLSTKDIFIYKNFFDYPYDFYENPELILTFLENSIFGEYLPSSEN
ncbi:MAG: hypothetical protein NZM09_05730 [Ignavibacterium sp.]|nr:hypothetical protein [Ignavibacterium sp.]MDW8375178.1 hypothetical protein [Ignavibacteriales bacterium]